MVVRTPEETEAFLASQRRDLESDLRDEARSRRCFPPNEPPDALAQDCYANNPNCSCRKAEQAKR